MNTHSRCVLKPSLPLLFITISSFANAEYMTAYLAFFFTPENCDHFLCHMNKRLLFIIYISYFVGLFLWAMVWSLVEDGVNKSGKNRSSVTGRGLSEHNPT